MKYEIAVYPTREKLMELAGSKDEAPIVMLNLLKFRDVADTRTVAPKRSAAGKPMPDMPRRCR